MLRCFRGKHFPSIIEIQKLKLKELKNEDIYNSLNDFKYYYKGEKIIKIICIRYILN